MKVIPLDEVKPTVGFQYTVVPTDLPPYCDHLTNILLDCAECEAAFQKEAALCL